MAKATRSQPPASLPHGVACCARTRACSAGLDAELEQAHGLAVPEYEVLLVLTESGDQHLPMSELADAALLTRSGMTRLVDRSSARAWCAASAARRMGAARTR